MVMVDPCIATWDTFIDVFMISTTISVAVTPSLLCFSAHGMVWVPNLNFIRIKYLASYPGSVLVADSRDGWTKGNKDLWTRGTGS